MYMYASHISIYPNTKFCISFWDKHYLVVLYNHYSNILILIILNISGVLYPWDKAGLEPFWVLLLTVFGTGCVSASYINWVAFYLFLCLEQPLLPICLGRLILYNRDDKEGNANWHRLFCLSNSATFTARNCKEAIWSSRGVKQAILEVSESAGELAQRWQPVTMERAAQLRSAGGI